MAVPPRVAMVSGGNRGIGLAIVRELLAHGWRVSVGTRNATDAFAGHDAAQVRTYRFDAQDAHSETEWVAATVRDFGGIDALVHNAGILSTRSVVEADDAEIDRLLEVNVKSPLRLTRKAWPHLLAADEGKVLVMASLAAKRVRTADASLYALSKAAVLSLAHGIRHCGADARALHRAVPGLRRHRHGGCAAARTAAAGHAAAGRGAHRAHGARAAGLGQRRGNPDQLDRRTPILKARQ